MSGPTLTVDALTSYLREHERERRLRAYLASINPDATPDEIDSIDLAIFDCGGCS